jgi:NAD(P) transhydrogenase subunit alpha
MKISVIRERSVHEKRVAISPDWVKKLKSLSSHIEVCVEQGAGLSAYFTDDMYQAAGAQLANLETCLLGTQVLLCVNAPMPELLQQLPANTVVIGLLNPYDTALQAVFTAQQLIRFSLDRLPRTTRAQSMDVLSSQANLAGYVAVMLAARHYPKLFPMLMTAAGTIKAARVLILGAGVAGLQAIATAKRLGAVVEVFDVRAAVKEQVESLGAKFIEVPLSDAEQELAKGKGGYAREMTPEYQARQSELIAKHVKQADVVITTALIPGKPAPILLTQEMVESMKSGSVVVDLAAPGGGNCALTQINQIVVHQGVSIVGDTNMPSHVAQDASNLYARNVFEFLKLMITDQGELNPNINDELLVATRLA